MGFRLCNLIVDSVAPEEMTITTAAGTWTIEPDPNYGQGLASVQKGMIAETHIAHIEVGVGTAGRSAAIDAAIDDLVPLCLAASYLTGNSVAMTRSVPGSEIILMAPGSHFPRPRAMFAARPVVSSIQALRDRIEAFTQTYTVQGHAEKARLLVHHWLDAMACWSMEDLCLSTSTLLEIIAATAGSAAAAQGSTKRTFVDRIDFAASRYSLPNLPSDFRNMRNDLVHEGTLSATTFPNKNVEDCAAAVTDALAWFDTYIHAALALGSIDARRFPDKEYRNLNAFSLD